MTRGVRLDIPRSRLRHARGLVGQYVDYDGASWIVIGTFENKSGRYVVLRRPRDPDDPHVALDSSVILDLEPARALPWPEDGTPIWRAASSSPRAGR